MKAGRPAGENPSEVVDLMGCAGASVLSAQTTEEMVIAMLPHATTALSARQGLAVKLDHRGNSSTVLARHGLQAEHRTGAISLEWVVQEWSSRSSRSGHCWLERLPNADGSFVCCLVNAVQVRTQEPAAEPVSLLMLFFTDVRHAIPPVAQAFFDWMAIAADVRQLSAHDAAEQPQGNGTAEAKHRINNVLGVITMHADLGSLLTDQPGLKRIRTLFDEISQQAQRCAQIVRTLPRRSS